MNKNKTPSKLLKKLSRENNDAVPYTKEEFEALLAQIQTLKQEDQNLDEELEEMNKKGVKITDSVLIMNALHEFNEMRDALVNVFEFLGNITQCTSADLHKKYNVPLE